MDGRAGVSMGRREGGRRGDSETVLHLAHVSISCWTDARHPELKDLVNHAGFFFSRKGSPRATTSG